MSVPTKTVGYSARVTSDKPDRPLLWGLGLGFAHALLLWLAFPPISLGVVGILAPVPLLLAAVRTDRPWRSGLGASLGTLPFWAYHHSWVFPVSVAGAPPLILIQSAWPGLFVVLGAVLVRRNRSATAFLSLAVLWTAVEFFRGRLFFNGYPWFLSAHPTADLPLARWASAIGVYGLGFLIALLGAAVLWWALDSQAKRRWIAPLVCLLLLSAGALFRAPASDARFVIGLVQTNLPQNNKMARSQAERIADFQEWALLTIDAAETDPAPELIVWPETMFPGPTLSPQAIAEFARAERELGYAPDTRSRGTLFVQPLLNLQENLGVPLLIGAVAHDDFSVTVDEAGVISFDSGAAYNSAFLISEGRIRTDRYDKIFLTPFGETMPYISNFPWLEQALLNLGARGMSFDLSAGFLPVRFSVPSSASGAEARVATPICFEMTIPHVCRRLVYGPDAAREADVLINMTNDGWFSFFDPGRLNHLLIARWRAIELGTPVVRAANTGVSCVVDASGRVLFSLDARQSAGVLVAEVPLPGPSRTIYALIGDSAGWAAFACSLVLLALRLFRRPTPSPASTA